MTILKLSSKKCGSGTGITVAGYGPSRFPTQRNAWPTEHRAFKTVSALTGLPLGEMTPLQQSCPNA